MLFCIGTAEFCLSSRVVPGWAADLSTRGPDPDEEWYTMIWMARLRLRVLAFVFGLGLTAIGLISLTALPALPILGVAVAAAAVGVNSMTARLKQSVCHGCGKAIGDVPRGAYGTVCPDCGFVTQVGEHPRLAAVDDPEPDDEPDRDG